MSYATVERDIEQRLINNWVTTLIDINENIEFNPPAETAWIKLRIREKDTNRKNIGSPGVHRAEGMIIIDVYTPLNTGTRTGKTYASQLGAIFRDAQFNGITCREAKTQTGGESNGWWVTPLEIPFFWDGRY